MHFDDRGTQENQIQRQQLSILFIKDIIQWLRYFLFNWRTQDDCRSCPVVYWPDAKITSPGPAVQWIFRALILNPSYFYFIQIEFLWAIISSFFKYASIWGFTQFCFLVPVWVTSPKLWCWKMTEFVLEFVTNVRLSARISLALLL